MKRSALKQTSELKRKSALAPGKGFARAAPMARGTSRMRNSKPASDKPKRAARNAGPDYLAMCRCQPCYLLLPGIRCTPIDTVAPCHSNQQRHGKGAALKALDIYTVPGCAACHRELDQGMRFTKEEKFGFWDRAYATWVVVRSKMIGA